MNFCFVFSCFSATGVMTMIIGFPMLGLFDDDRVIVCDFCVGVVIVLFKSSCLHFFGHHCGCA